MEPTGERRYYSLEDIEHRLAFFESEYGMTTAEFVRRHLAGEQLSMPGFVRGVWASTIATARRMRGGLSSELDRVLAAAS